MCVTLHGFHMNYHGPSFFLVGSRVSGNVLGGETREKRAKLHHAQREKGKKGYCWPGAPPLCPFVHFWPFSPRWPFFHICPLAPLFPLLAVVPPLCWPIWPCWPLLAPVGPFSSGPPFRLVCGPFWPWLALLCPSWPLWRPWPRWPLWPCWPFWPFWPCWPLWPVCPFPPGWLFSPQLPRLFSLVALFAPFPLNRPERRARRWEDAGVPQTLRKPDPCQPARAAMHTERESRRRWRQRRGPAAPRQRRARLAGARALAAPLLGYAPAHRCPNIFAGHCDAGRKRLKLAKPPDRFPAQSMRLPDCCSCASINLAQCAFEI